ncbi:MAG: response regulator [Gammaproteobacteria bacterium]|nr:response regulator [Gammaproteobacteria bacterium]MBU1480504.1 response regulator [Gammaproteobacteria bacterium]
MPANLLRLDEDRVLVEQLRLLMGNVGSSVIPGFLLALLMLVVLSNDSNTMGLGLWCAAVILSKLNIYFLSRRNLASGIPHHRAHRLVWILMLLNGLDGALWGALTWATLDTTTMTGSILVISVVAGILGSAMSLMAPVLPVFIVFVFMELAVVVAKLWLLGDPAYNALGIAGILYLAALLSQGLNSARAARAAIKLRFENVELVDQLRVETGVAATAQREAELANTAKSKFLAAASHDLRQPIHAQGLFLEVLSRTDLNDYQRELLNSARATSEASGEMLNTLLDFSRIEAGVIEPQIQPFRLQPLLNKIENEHAPQANAKDIVYRSRETDISVRTDPVLLELILRNLVSNAVRYTQQGGILVACRRRGDQAVLEIWDTGVGIETAQQQEVFREFHQLGNPERDRHKGLGLGLAIADGLSRTLGHRLTLASTPQRGSVFRLTMPIDNAISDLHVAMKQSRTRLLNARLLVVDDDAIVREGMLHLLRDWGCECEAAESIEEALELASAHPPDLVISDYRLREQRTGVEAIAALRELLGNNLPAILLTGDTAPKRLREAKSSGIPLMHKPVSAGQLYRRVVEVMQEANQDKPAHSADLAE